MNTIRATIEFEKQARKLLSLAEYHKFAQFRMRLRDNCWLGDAVHPHWLREMRLDGKRIYFKVEGSTVTFVALSTKQNQQKVIEKLRKEL